MSHANQRKQITELLEACALKDDEIHKLRSTIANRCQEDCSVMRCVSRVEVNETDSDNLADIIWFIKGRMTKLRDMDERSELGHDHIESLRKFRESFQNIIKTKENIK